MTNEGTGIGFFLFLQERLTNFRVLKLKLSTWQKNKTMSPETAGKQ